MNYLFIESSVYQISRKTKFDIPVEKVKYSQTQDIMSDKILYILMREKAFILV